MNLNYIVKRCRGFGWATKLSDIKWKQLSVRSPEIIYIRDSMTGPKPKGSLATNDLDALYEETMAKELDDECFEKQTVFLVELGVPTQVDNHIDVAIPEEEIDAVIDSSTVTADIDEKLKETYKLAMKDVFRQPESYLKQDFNATFIQYIKDVYPLINDTKFQRTLLKILVKHSIRVDELIKEHPLNFKIEKTDTIRTSAPFKDVLVSDPYFEKSKNELEDEHTNGVLKEFSSQAIAKFNGFGNKFAQVDNSKKRASIPDINMLRNHNVIHMLARNKIVATPKTSNELSISKLMKLMSRYKNFSVIFIWPNYQNGFRYAETPTKMMEIDSSGGNVILCVFFRAMCIHFFGMHSTISHTDYYQKYLL